MKQRILLFVAAVGLMLALAACGVCQHQWKDATCNAPKTCTLCGQTYGANIAHTWTDATCDAPKTCSVCKATEGEAKGHSWLAANCQRGKICAVCNVTEGEVADHFWADATCTSPKTCILCNSVEGQNAAHSWVEATCTSPKTCSVCNLTEGDKAGHIWQEATKEAPKTCTVCKATEGSPITTDSRFNIDAATPLLGTWSCDGVLTGAMLEMPDFPGEHAVTVYCTLADTGSVSTQIEFKDMEALKASAKVYVKAMILKEMGIGEAEANALFLLTQGKTLDQYANDMVEELDIQELVAENLPSGVYYVEGDKIYMASDWNEEFTGYTFALEGDTLTVKGASPAEEGADLVFLHVKEA